MKGLTINQRKSRRHLPATSPNSPYYRPTELRWYELVTWCFRKVRWLWLSDIPTTTRGNGYVPRAPERHSLPVVVCARAGRSFIDDRFPYRTHSKIKQKMNFKNWDEVSCLSEIISQMTTAIIVSCLADNNCFEGLRNQLFLDNYSSKEVRNQLSLDN